MLGKQTTAANAFANQMNTYGQEDRGYSTGSRGKIDEAYWNLYNNLGTGGGGGGGGGGYTPLTWANARENEALAGYRNLRDTGGWSSPEMQDFRSRANSVVPGFFENIRNQLSAANAGLSGNVGYGSQMAKLARDAARQAGETNLNAEVDLQGQIRSAKERGLEGVGKYDTEYMQNQQRVEQLRNQEIANQRAAAMAAAGRSRANAQQEFADKMSILGNLRELRGESGSDLPYFDRSLAGLGAATNTITNRVAEPSLGQQILGGVGMLAGAAAPFLPTPGPKQPKYRGYSG